MPLTVENLYSCYKISTGVSIDTRTLEKGELFIGVSGPNFNGDDYAQQALAKGASFAVVQSKGDSTHEQILHYRAGGIEALRQLAKRRRAEWNIPVIGLTGSNGKTTTKELTAAVLSTTYKTYATTGNLNNHLGVPLTILRAPAGIEVLIVEMGANHQKEIEYLADIVQPTIGLITNIGKAHLEGFGGEEGVFLGKKELFDYLAQTSHLALVNNDDEKVIKAATEVANRIDFKTSMIFEACSDNGANFLRYKVSNQWVDTQITGSYNYQNMAAAISVARYLDVPEQKIHQAISLYTPANNRSQLIKKENSLIVLDAYNANPDSMLASITNFEGIKTSYEKVAVLGEMLELGSDSKDEHQHIIDYCREKGLRVILMGQSWTPCNTDPYPIYADLSELDSNTLFDNKAVLLKGSRAVGLERLIQ